MKIYKDSILSCNKSNISFLLSLDFFLLFTLSTTFYSFRNSKLFGISGSCLKWIFFYLSNRSSVVSIKNSFYSFLFPIWCSSGFCSWSFFLFFTLLNSHKLFHHFLIRVNFMLMILEFLLHFLNMKYLLLSLKFHLILVK